MLALFKQDSVFKGCCSQTLILIDASYGAYAVVVDVLEQFKASLA